MYLFDTESNKLKASVPFDAALLDCCFAEHDALAFTSGLNRQVMKIDWNTLKTSILGTHEDAIKALVFSNTASTSGILFSGSWDSSVTAWNPASMSRIVRITVPGKVYSMDVAGNYLIVGMSERHVQIFDIRKLSEPWQTRESSLRHQTRCVRLFPDASAYAISSIEGRVGVEYLDPNQQANNFAFKCHRAPMPDQENMEMVYPVNALAFHPRYSFAPARRVSLPPLHTHTPSTYAVDTRRCALAGAMAS